MDLSDSLTETLSLRLQTNEIAAKLNKALDNPLQTSSTAEPGRTNLPRGFLIRQALPLHEVLLDFFPVLPHGYALRNDAIHLHAEQEAH